MAPSIPTNDRGALTGTSLPAPIKAAAFWTAVLLPFFAFALLMRGLSTPVEYAFFVSLIAVNVVALVVGHGYGNE
jgi:hypothetical protein